MSSPASQVIRSFRNAKTPAELAALLREPTLEQARALAQYLGETRFQRLRELANRLSPSRGLTDGRPNVVVLPGVMGSELSVTRFGEEPLLVWIHRLRILLGGLDALELDPAGRTPADDTKAFAVQPTNVMNAYYADLLLHLAREHNVLPFPYDWRLDVSSVAQRLEGTIRERFGGQPVVIVAHSMGGLVARSLMAHAPKALNDEPLVTRLVMLGTPNRGSFEVPLILSGLQDSVRKLSYLAFPRTSVIGKKGERIAKTLKIVSTFPSVYQMMPVLEDSTEPLYDVQTYKDVNSYVSATHLGAAKEFQKGLKSATIDPKQMVYVAGYGKPTVTGLKKDFTTLNDFASYEVTTAGDGKVPHALGLIDGVVTFYAPVEHGDLARDPLVLAGIDDLVRAGTTRALPLTLPGDRGGEEATILHDWAARKHQQAQKEDDDFQKLVEFARDDSDPQEEGVALEDGPIETELLRGFVSGARPLPPSTAATVRPKIKVNVLQCNISECHDPKKTPGFVPEYPIDAIAAGVYSGVHVIWGAVGDVDRSITDALQVPGAVAPEPLLEGMAERGLLRGDLAVPTLIVDPRDKTRQRHLVVVGMGPPGQFGAPELKMTAHELVWFLTRQGKKHLATLLIGAGKGNLSIEAALPAFLSGLIDAQFDTRTGDPAAEQLQELTFVEFFGERVRTFDVALRAAQRAFEARLDLVYQPIPEATLSEYDRRGLSRRVRDLERELIEAEDPRASRMAVEQVGEAYLFSAITFDAAIPQRRQEIHPSLIEDANNAVVAAVSQPAQVLEGQTLAKRLIPRDFRPLFSTSAPLVIEVNPETARLHWELMVLPIAGRDGEASPPLGLARALTRQLRTLVAPPPEPPPSARRVLRVLVVADPASDARLRGAEREGQEVAELFETFNRFAMPDGARVDVTRLFGPYVATSHRFLQELDNNFDVLHFAGHASYEKDKPLESGFLFHAGRDGNPREVITARELRTIDRLPRFVFANACESGITSNRPEDRNASVAPSFAETFFEQGVTNFICTGWPVGDAAARLFARIVYAGLLGLAGAPDDVPRVIGVTAAPVALFEALRAAREAVAGFPNGIRTWGAYQHYGNPFTRFFPRNLPRLRGGQPVSPAAPPAKPAARRARPSTPSEPPGTDRFADVKAVIAGRLPELLRLPGVVSVRPGFRYARPDPQGEGSWSTGEPAIIVSVRELIEAEDLPPTERIPTTLEEVPVEVVPASIEEQLRQISGDRSAPGLDAVPLAERLSLPGESYDVIEEAEDRALSPYVPPAGVSLDAVDEKMRMTLHVSPDAGFPVLSDFLGKTTQSMTVAMYDFTAPHVLAVFKQKMKKASIRSVDLLLDPRVALSNGGKGVNPKKDDLREEVVRDQLTDALGDKFRFCWAAVKLTGKVRQGIFPISYHIKVAVRDGKAFWLSSGNWQSTNQPPLSVLPAGGLPGDAATVWGLYNREWHLVVEHPGLAETFRKFILNDFTHAAPLQEVTRGPVKPEPELDVLVPEPTRGLGPAERFDPLELDKKIKVQPVLTPDNYADVVLPLIKSARKSLCFQNQYVAIGVEVPRAFQNLLDALVEQAEALGNNFRMILREIGDVRLMLEKLEEMGFDMKTQVKVQPATHTKGIIVDGTRVLVGSHNWSGLGVTRNRDASLLIDDAQVAGYFQKVFDHDWERLARRKLLSKRQQPRLSDRDATRGARPPAGFTSVPLSVYLEE